jgi:hypothetical protein
MYPVKTSTATASKPPYSAGGTPGYFTKGDAVAGIPATVPGQDFFNMTQEELLNVIRTAGLTPDAADDTQLTQAIQAMISDASVSVGAASTTAAGVVELATNEETSAGTDSERAVTPAGLKGVTDLIYSAMPEAGMLGGRDYFGTPGTYTWTPPSGVTHVYILGAGGGGGGGGNSYGGEGGGAGDSCLLERYEVSGSVSITIGAGGAGVTSATTSGGNGGATSFGSHRTLPGGTGGKSNWPNGAITAAAGGPGGRPGSKGAVPGGHGGSGLASVGGGSESAGLHGGGGGGGFTGTSGGASSTGGNGGDGFLLILY